MRVQSYRDLLVWKKSMLMVKHVYQVTAQFPVDERFGLTQQMRRAAVSIASNIAEGHARASTADFQRYLLIAMGSVAELETQTMVSSELGFVPPSASDGVLTQLDEINKMLRGLHQSLERRKGG